MGVEVLQKLVLIGVEKVVHMSRTLTMVITLLFALNVWCTQPSKPNTTSTIQQQPVATPTNNFVTFPPENPSHTEEKNNKAVEWALGDKIAAIVALFAFLQFLALLATFFVMQGTAKRQLRAYVLPQDASIYNGMTLIPPQPARHSHYYVAIRLQNHGQTPAYNLVVAWAATIIQIANENIALNIQIPIGSAPFTLNVDTWTDRSVWSPVAISPAEIAGLTSNPPTHAIYMFGRVEYVDAFKKKHFGNFRYRYTGAWPPTNAFELCSNGNDSD